MGNNNSCMSIQLKGGLGNMMFQIASAYATSIRDEKCFYCDVNMHIIPHKHYSYYIDNIFRKVTFQDKENINFYYSEPNFSFSGIPSHQGNVEISGYFQSEKYFINSRNEILELFEPDEKTKIKIDSFFEQFKEIPTCSIHVRRGDYINAQNYHCLQELEYYKNSINLIGDNNHFLIFSDDISWCIENFSFLKEKTFISSFLDYEQLYLMSLCNHNIITNSTYSWWGAWLNKNENKKVVSPKNWFGPANQHLETKDVYCQDWYII